MKLERFLTLTALAAAANAGAACSSTGASIDGGATLDADAVSSETTADNPDANKPTTSDNPTGDAHAPSTTTDEVSTISSRRDAGRDVDAYVPSDGGGGGQAGAVDLQIQHAIIDPSFTTVEVAENSCEIQDGCYGAAGKRTVIPFELTITNAGTGPLEIGAPWDNDNFYLSSCASQYLTTNFVKAEVLSNAGAVLAVRSLPTSCIADEGSNTYSCSVQGLEAGGTSEQPRFACEGLDVTGLAAGEYTVRFTINADGRFAENNISNNSVEVTLEKPECEENFCGGVCCPETAQCVDGQCLLPDLRANKDAVERSLVIQKQTFGENACEIAEMCITGPGKRRLLQFEGRIENAGLGDLNPGQEHDNPLFEHSECHGHYHFLDFTDYKLLAQDGSTASQGHKQSFCLVDMEPVEDYEGPAYGYPPTHPAPGDTGCSYLSAGWADIYGVGTPCQWVDITDVAPGEYVLQVTVNPKGKIAESNVENNIIQVPVTIPADSNCQEEEICGDLVDQDCDRYPDHGDPDCYQELCCGAEDLCNLSGNWSCDCNGEPQWEQGDCSDGGSGEYPVPECCNEEDSCNWEHDGVCDCNGDFEWDALDCDYDYPDPCCSPFDYCGYAQDGYCDCDGQFEWDSYDCSGWSPDGGDTSPTTPPFDGGPTITPNEAGSTNTPSEAGLMSEAGGPTTSQPDAKAEAGATPDGAADAQ